MKKFFYEKEIEIIKEYEYFNIALVKESDTADEYYIDKNLISYKRIEEKSINISYINWGT